MSKWTIHSPHRQIRSEVLAIGVLILLGIFFRVVNLGERVYWVDEVATSIRVAGYTRAEVVSELADGRLLQVEDLQHYQHLSAEKNWSDTLAALQHSPEHAPLYFLLARAWSHAFGSSVVAMRSFSVLLSVLALPCLFVLSWELFASVEVAALAMGLLAVSPFFVAYAQEARPYSLWSGVLLVNGWLLLRALRCQDKFSWWGYGITAAVALYTSLLSSLVLLAQGMYVRQLEQGRWSTGMRNYLLAFTGAIGVFTPWLGVMAQHWGSLQDNTTWMRDPLNYLSMTAIWLYSLVILFFDVPVSTALNGATIAKIFTALAVLSLMGFSLYWLCRQTSKRVCLFVLTLTLPVPLALIAIDLILNGQASATPRYLIPCQLGLLLAIAYLVGQKTKVVSGTSNQHFYQQFWRGVAVFLFSISLLSNIINLNRIPDYQKARNRENGSIATILNQANQPLLITEPDNAMDLLSLSHGLNSTVQAQISSINLPLRLSQCRTVFWLSPSDSFKQKTEQINDFILKEVYQPTLLTSDDVYLSLWQIKNSNPACINQR